MEDGSFEYGQELSQKEDGMIVENMGQVHFGKKILQGQKIIDRPLELTG